MTDTSTFHVLNLYVAALRARVAATEGDESKRARRRLKRLEARIADGRPVVLTGASLREVGADVPGILPDSWYHLRPDGTTERVGEYHGVEDSPPAASTFG